MASAARRAPAASSSPVSSAGPGPGAGAVSGSTAEEAWYDDAAGPVVRPYAVTRGRTRPAGNLDLVTLMITTGKGARTGRSLPPEQREILRLCHSPHSVAEAAANAGLPLGTTRVLLGDLVTDGLVTAWEPPTTAPTEKILRRVLVGLRAL
ncbi:MULTISPECIES: DUF742 domain-containing protein [Catenuloplanes]|uniref:DUF742 domain-containing protein n=1 Tax=Catenuloplanes niger TaxID=587534 RepID=A0AAE3ZM10_9ACTN|nr:DUF742 domain-containing protein [Catenuloplanes niger]MDR7322383.1 hypothetical protein [Catenuloplanes niger]